MENVQTKSVKKTKKSPKQIVVFLAINVLAIFLLMAFTLWWQNDLSFLAFADGIWFVFAFQLTMAWSLFVYNQNIFTPLVHGVKTFFLLFVGRKPKEDYFHYYSKIKDNPIATPYIVVTFLLTLVILVVGILLMLEAY
jgi:hypothetical protein